MKLRVNLPNNINILLSTDTEECSHCESFIQTQVFISFEDANSNPSLTLGGVLSSKEILKLRDFFNSINLSK